MLRPSHPPHLSHLLSNPNNPASGTTARVARNLALLVPALAQVVRAAVHDDGAAEHAFGPDELDLLVRQGALCVALRVRLEVAQVADVAFRVGGGAVGFGEGVDCISREGRRGVWVSGDNYSLARSLFVILILILILILIWRVGLGLKKGGGE